MGAGLTKDQERSAKYRNLKRMEQELRQAGVSAKYESKSVVNIDGPGTFSVSYGDSLRASNGETFGCCQITIDHPEIGQEDYFLLETSAGLTRIKALFGNEQWRAKRKQTDLQRLVILVERLVRKDTPVYLHDVNGHRLSQNEGQIYAYNEMRDGKPMLRLGCTNDSYLEFQPGFTVRDEAGNILLERKE